MIGLLHIHWGFLVSGGGRYAQMLEQLPSIAPIATHSVCILSPDWSVDQAGLGRLQHTRVAIRGRLDRSWVGPVCREIEQRRPDLVMTHGFNAHFVAWTCLAVVAVAHHAKARLARRGVPAEEVRSMIPSWIAR